jgi:hypothetical protein
MYFRNSGATMADIIDLKFDQYLNGLISKNDLWDFVTHCNVEPFYDYENQAWTLSGRYLPCNHPESMNCSCYGKTNCGKPVAKNAVFYSNC